MRECIMNLLTKICESICSLGWNEIGTMATVAAVVVALFANRNANEQLKAALKIQEQSKNVDLFEKRIRLLQQIEEDETIYIPELTILFANEIVLAYENIEKISFEKKSAEHDLTVYYTQKYIANMDTNEDTFKEKIEMYLSQLNQNNFPHDIEQEYIEYCNSESITFSETGRDEDLKKYNFIEIQGKINSLQAKYNSEKDGLLQMMREFISDSIKPLNSKVGSKRV